MLALTDYAGLPAPALEALRSRFAPLRTLEQLLEAGRSDTAPISVDEVIAQDEYSHDVLVAIDGGRYLAFDTT